VRRLPGVLFYGVRAFRLVYLATSRNAERRPNQLTRDETWRIAANIAKLPQGLLQKPRASIDHFRYDLNSRHFAGLRSMTSWLLHFASAFSRWLRAMS
jgi:hypothetical protein